MNVLTPMGFNVARAGGAVWAGGAMACAVLVEAGAEVDSGVGSRAAVGLVVPFRMSTGESLTGGMLLPLWSRGMSDAYWSWHFCGAWNRLRRQRRASHRGLSSARTAPEQPQRLPWVQLSPPGWPRSKSWSVMAHRCQICRDVAGCDELGICPTVDGLVLVCPPALTAKRGPGQRSGRRNASGHADVATVHKLAASLATLARRSPRKADVGRPLNVGWA